MNRCFASRAAPLALALTTAAGVWSTPAAACSTCKCGDYTINLFGSEKAFEQRLRFGAEYLNRSESAGDPADNQRSTDEQRLLLGVSYSLTQDLTLALQLPLVKKTITDSNLARQQAEGIGDIDLVGRWTLYRKGALRGRHLAGLRFGLRLPTTRQARDGNGELLDIDVQPDAGSTAPSVGAWYAYYAYPWHFTATATYTSFSHGHQDFAPGDASVVSVLGQYAVAPKLALQLGLDTRHSSANSEGAETDVDSGGLLATALVGAAVRASDDLVFHLGVQLPVIENLNGHQDEQPTYRLGVAYDL